MEYKWLHDYCLAKKGAEKDFKEEWNATRYLIRGKMYIKFWSIIFFHVHK